MAQTDIQSPTPPPGTTNFLRRLLFGYGNNTTATSSDPKKSEDDAPQRTGLIRRVSRKVVPGLPRMQTFKRQQSEKRTNLAPVQPTPAERRALSVDRRAVLSRTTSRISRTATETLPRSSAPDFLEPPRCSQDLSTSEVVNPHDSGWQSDSAEEFCRLDAESQTDPNIDLDPNPEFDDNDEKSQDPWAHDTESITASQIQEELETTWILNLSMHFRDKSNREKFFVTYREQCETEVVWRRVTISLDYRKAPEDSLEMELTKTKFQRDKSAKIYEAIRDSLSAIRFYDTVTNLKLQTTDGRLHVHVAEDLNEIISYPPVREVQHLRCRRIRERDIAFDSHMSGFVYKVHVGGQVLIKKEIPGPDTINEFIYEINALYSLQYSSSVITFFGVVVDNKDEHVKGLLISYAERGSLMDILYDHRPNNEQGLPRLPFTTRATWAKQVVQGLADIHESGFVQGDFTLSNIVIDSTGNAKIIDINRRGCPVGWEPPEARPLLKSSQGISMYIGVKSDLYQLGMVLWALAMEDDEPEKYGPRLALEPDVDVPSWYRRLVEICLSDEPRMRLQAASLLCLFPSGLSNGSARHMARSPSQYGSYVRNGYPSEGARTNGIPEIRAVSPSDRWTYTSFMHPDDASFAGYDAPYGYPPRGRSPPSPLPSNFGQYDTHRAHGSDSRSRSRSANVASYSDDAGWDANAEDAESIDLARKEDEMSKLSNACAESLVARDVDEYVGSERREEAGKEEREKEATSPQMVATGDADDDASTPQQKFIVLEARNEDDATDATADVQATTNADPATAVNRDAEAGLTEHVDDMEGGQILANGLGILSATGITEPKGQIDSGTKDMTASESGAHEKSGESAGLTEPGEPPNVYGREAAVVISVDGDESGVRDGVNTDTDTLAAKAPTQHSTHDKEVSQRSIQIQTLPCRSSEEEVLSILAGVGGADGHAIRDVSVFPTSLDGRDLVFPPPGMSTAMQGLEEIPVTAVVDVKDG